MQRGAPLRVQGLQVGAPAHQQAARERVAVQRGEVQRRPPVTVCSVSPRPELEQILRAPTVPVAARQMHRRACIAGTCRVRVEPAVVDELPQDVLPAAASCAEEQAPLRSGLVNISVIAVAVRGLRGGADPVHFPKNWSTETIVPAGTAATLA